MALKRCVKCEIWKDEGEFAWRYSLLGARQKACRSCRARENAQWYERHHDEHRENVKVRKAKARGEAQRFIYDYLSYKKCVDCGEYDYAVLTFDHVRGTKKKDIARMIADGDSIGAIKEEISKTEIVCSNCHMRREQKRRSGQPRFFRFWPKHPGDDE